MIRCLDKIYEKLVNFFYSLSPGIYDLAERQEKLLKFIIVGSLVTGLNVFLLYIFTEFLGIWYLVSAGLAFITALFTSFFLQKLWTFRDSSPQKDVNSQIRAYVFLVFSSLAANLIGMYILVSIFRVYYLLAQLVVAGSLAIIRFLINNFLIFKDETPSEQE